MRNRAVEGFPASPRYMVAAFVSILSLLWPHPSPAAGRVDSARGPELLTSTLVPPVDETSGPRLAVRWHGEPGARLSLTIIASDGIATEVVTQQPLRAGVNLLRLPIKGNAHGTLRLRVHDAAGALLATREEGLPLLRSSSGFAWKPTFVSGGPDAPVRAAVVWDDGTGPSLIVGGSFLTAGHHVVNGVARWDGDEWSPLVGPSGIGVDLEGGRGWVAALAVFDGALIVAGRFSLAGGELVANIARWDGSNWSPLAGPSGFGVAGGQGHVNALVVYDDALFAGGSFDFAGAVPAGNVARWDGGDWSTLSGPSGTGTDGEVYSLAVFDEALIAGGAFREAGGVTVNHVARWDGRDWSPLSGPSGTGVNSGVMAISEYQGALIVGGGFTQAGGVGVQSIARWDGGGWSPLSQTPGISSPGSVWALAVYRGDLVVGGWFTRAGGVVVDNIALWNGAHWAPLEGPSGTGTGSAWSAPVLALTEFGGDLIVAGSFQRAGGLPVDHLARWNGASWASLPEPLASTRLDGGVSALTVYRGELVAGGGFTHAGGVPVNHIARWDGRRWWPLSGPSATGMDGSVWLLGVYDGALVAGGSFRHAGGVEVNGLARWEGDRWSALAGPGGGGLTMDGGPAALAVYQGNLIVGGGFTQADGIEVDGLARWDGSQWSALEGSSGTRVAGGVSALVVYQGELVVAGFLYAVGDGEPFGLARWDGSDWSLFSGPDDPSWVEALGLYGGDLVAVGDFVPEWGVPANSIARWDGSRWRPVAGPSGRGIEGGVSALAAYEGSLIAAGWFQRAGMEWVHNIARWDGGEWQPLSGPAGAGTDDRISALAVYGQDLVAAGGFLLTGGVPNRFIGLYGPEDCSPGPTTLCIDDQPGDRRFEVRLDYQTVQAGGLAGHGQAVPLAGLGLSRGGLFHFGNPTNPEMLLKVLDGCAINGRGWLFYSAGTNLGFVVRVRDTHTGQVARYENADLNAAVPVQDTSAFQCSPGTAGKNDSWSGAARAWPAAEAFPFYEAEGRSGDGCVTDQHVVCIDQRFRIEIDYHTSQAGGLSGTARAIPLSGVGVHRGGLFYFVDPTNPEVLIKVLDGCAINGRYWVFYSAGTNLGLQVKVTDTVTGYEVEYTNPDLTAAPPIQDTSALPCG